MKVEIPHIANIDLYPSGYRKINEMKSELLEALTNLRYRISQDRTFYYGFLSLTTFKMQYFIASVDDETNQIYCYNLIVSVFISDCCVATKYVLRNHKENVIGRSQDCCNINQINKSSNIRLMTLFGVSTFKNRKFMFLKVQGSITGPTLSIITVASRCLLSDLTLN